MTRALRDVRAIRTSRGLTLGLLTALIAIAYVDRVSVAHAIGPASLEFGWDAVQTGWVLSAFSWGYVAAMTPGGWIVDRVGGRRAVVAGAAIWALVSASAVAVTGAWALAINRLVLGASEAPAFPAAASITAHDFSPGERGRATALFDGGSYIGMAIGGPLIAAAVAFAGWRAGFMAAAGLTVVWLATSVAVLGFHRQPAQASRSQTLGGPRGRIAFLLRQPTIWSLGLGFFGYNYVKSFYLTWFALYLTGSIGMSAMGSGMAAALPPVIALIASLSVGHMTDRLAHDRPEAQLGQLRGRITAGAMVGAAVIAVVPVLPGDSLRIMILSLAFAANIAASPGIWALPADLAPETGWVGSIGGLVNTMSNVGGIVSPIATGYLVKAAMGDFDLALFVTGGVALLSAVSFLSGGRFGRLTRPANV